MNLYKIILLVLTSVFAFSGAVGQANASINILTLNSGVVSLGQSLDIQVSVGNTGPTSSIGINKVRAQISVPTAICSILPNTEQVGLPAGWIILSNTGGVITVCNGTDLIPVGAQRQIYIRVQGNAVGGPSTVAGNLSFGPGTGVCTGLGSLSGDNTADNVSQSTIQVTPAASCTLGVIAIAGTIVCNGGTTTLNATSTGATGTVEYSISGGTSFQTNNTFTVPAGIYNVTARESNNIACAAISASVTVIDPLEVTAPTVSVVHPTCTVATGTITIISAIAGLKFNLDGGAYETYPANGYTVVAGLHTLTTQNSSGCISDVASVTINAQPPTPATPTVGTIAHPTCTVSAGSVVLNNLPSGNWIINPGAMTGNTSSVIINDLTQGSYNFTVTNSLGCISPASADVVINNVPGAPPPTIVNVVHPTCTVTAGAITITSTTIGLTFSLDGGAYVAYPAGGYAVATGSHTLTAQNEAFCKSAVTNITVNAPPTTPEAPTVNVLHPTCTVASGTIILTSITSGLTLSLDGGAFTDYPAGGYTVTTGAHTLKAQNASGCISTVTNIIVNAQPVLPTVSVLSGSIACFGGITSITVIASGGQSPFEYSLNGGAFQSANTFIVSAGTHTVTVRDADSCTTTKTITIVQPDAITATASASGILSGCQSVTAALIVSTKGGTGTLQYSLNGGTFQPGNHFILGAGTYAVTVKDANNCTVVTTPVTITQTATLTASATAKRVAECGGTTVVTVAASGGMTPYTSGDGTFARGPGTWTFTVTDAAGCTANTEITIEAPGCMKLHVYPNPAGNTINVNHSIAASRSTMKVFSINGTLMVTKPIEQNAFQTTIDISELATGNYVIVYWNGNEKKAMIFEKLISN